MIKLTIGTILTTLFLIAFAPSIAGYGAAKKCADKPNGRVHPVRITVPGDVSKKPKVDKGDVSVCTGDFVVWTGAQKFDIEFKNNRTPSDKIKFATDNGASLVPITKQYVGGGNNRYDYNVIVPGHPPLDPGVIIKD